MKKYTIQWKAELRSESVVEALNRDDAISKASLKQKAERAIDKRAINWKVDNIKEINEKA